MIKTADSMKAIFLEFIASAECTVLFISVHFTTTCIKLIFVYVENLY